MTKPEIKQVASDLEQQGETIIVTRPSPYGEALVEHLRQHKFNALHHSLIDFSPTINHHAGKEVNYLELLQTHQVWIFISQQAVNFLFARLTSEQISNLISTNRSKQIIAIGPATQTALDNKGFKAITPKQANSESILDSLSSIHSLQNSKMDSSVLLIRGNSGRQLLSDQVPKKHSLTELQVYQRVPIETNRLNFNKLVLSQNSKVAIIVTSSQLLILANEMLNIAGYNKENFTIICPSKRINQQARELGYTNCYTAASAGHQDILMACNDWKKIPT